MFLLAATVLSLFRASEVAVEGLVVVVEGLVAVRDVVVVRLVAVVVTGLVTGLVEEIELGRAVAGFLSAVVPATLDLRSREDVVDFTGALVEALPTKDIRLAVPEIPLRSSPELATPELATDRGFSSAELLTDARDRWEAAVDEVNGLRAVVVVGGRVGGLFKVVPPIDVREDVVDLGADDMEVGRFVVVEPDSGRLVVDVVLLDVGLFFAGDILVFSFPASGLVMGSSLPERMLDSTGVAGGRFSPSASTGAGGGGMGSSVEAMVVKFCLATERV